VKINKIIYMQFSDNPRQFQPSGLCIFKGEGEKDSLCIFV